MKPTTEELLLAAQVRQLAHAKLAQRMPDGLTPTARAEYFAAHSNGAVDDALQELTSIAMLITALRASAS